MNVYEEQHMRIRWNNAVTDYFTIRNGVKQGGVLSPILFSLYLDHIISRLRHIGMGCHMNGLLTGVFIYADGLQLFVLMHRDVSRGTPLQRPLTFSISYMSSINRCHATPCHAMPCHSDTILVRGTTRLWQ